MKHYFTADGEKSLPPAEPFDLQESFGDIFHCIDRIMMEQREDHGSLSQYRGIRRRYLLNRPSSALLFRYLGR